MRKSLVTLIVTLIFHSLILAQNDTGKATNSEMIKIKNNLFVLKTDNANAVVFTGNNGVFLINTLDHTASEQLVDDIKKASKKPIDFVINTDYSLNRNGGNKVLESEGATLFCHKNTRENIANAMRDNRQKAGTVSVPKAVITTDLSFFYNNEEIIVNAQEPINTDGDLTVYFKNQNVFYAGAIFNKKEYPMIDKEMGGSMEGLIEFYDKALKDLNKDVTIICGNGEVATYNDLKFTRNMLTFLWKRVSYHYINLKSEEEVVALTELTQPYDDKGFGKGEVKGKDLVRFLYKKVKAERPLPED